MKVLVVGCGQMGTSHARAYEKLPQCDIVGLVSRTPPSREMLSKELGGKPTFSSFEEAIVSTQPDLVSINTYPETHYPYVMESLRSGAHVFIEKPLAETVEQAEEILNLAAEKNLKVVVGYILQHHPLWSRFVEEARKLGGPLVMRMNLNQQSSGHHWEIHQNLMHSLSPIVDCGVHYVDMMCRMTDAEPVSVHATGARLSDEIAQDMYNYGQLQVTFSDGSVGWYESGWGPMVSTTARFVKDVIGPKGCVSIVADDQAKSDEIEGHTKANILHLHRSDLNEEGEFVYPDEKISLSDEPDHDQLCLREQEYFLRAIEEDLNLADHWKSVLNSQRIVLSADESVRNARVVSLQNKKFVSEELFHGQ